MQPSAWLAWLGITGGQLNAATKRSAEKYICLKWRLAEIQLTRHG